MSGVVIYGRGVAACTCAHLLRTASVPVLQQGAGRARLPAIVVPGATQALIRDVFGRDIFGGLHRIERRVVAWGPTVPAASFAHDAVVISEQELTDRLGGGVGQEILERTEWAVIAQKPLPELCVEHAFGTRRASAVPVVLAERADAGACVIESLEDGWLFLVPVSRERGWLLAVGGPAGSMLASSGLVVEWIAETGDQTADFAAYPRIADPPGGAGWLAGGSAAIGFDPLCGDGTGNAVREAILAAAVIRAAASGGEVAGLVAHYRSRLIAGFQRHLELCRQFYQTGGTGGWWQTELALLMQGIDWCRRELAGSPGFQYRLDGFELKSIGAHPTMEVCRKP